MAKLRIGIVGCGKIADCNHIPGYKSCKNIEIAAVCDIVPEKMTSTIAKHELGTPEQYTSFEEMLKSAKLDAVSICTPNDCHYPMTLAALAAGLNVLCDKPMAFNTDQCTKMIQAAEKSGKLLHINHSWHYNSLGNTIRQLVEKGKIGDLVTASCVSCSTQPPHLAWSPGADWFVQAAHEGSLIQDIGVHLSELMQWTSGQQIVEAASYTTTRFPGIDVVDNVTAIFKFANGALGTLELSWTSPVGEFTFELKGTAGVIAIRDWKIYYQKLGAKKPREIKLKEYRQNSQQNFVAAIRGKSVQRTPGRVGREAIAICNAVTESGVTGKFAKVKKF